LGVVAAPIERIAEHPIGLLQQAKGLLGLLQRQLGGVGVVALAEVAEGLAQLQVAGGAGNLQSLVVAATNPSG
jgi:hypothetical protein